ERIRRCCPFSGERNTNATEEANKRASFLLDLDGPMSFEVASCSCVQCQLRLRAGQEKGFLLRKEDLVRQNTCKKEDDGFIGPQTQKRTVTFMLWKEDVDMLTHANSLLSYILYLILLAACIFPA